MLEPPTIRVETKELRTSCILAGDNHGSNTKLSRGLNADC